MNYMAPINFTISMVQWIKAGCPMRSPEWVEEIFVTHCKPCEFYNDGRNLLMQSGYCEKCGCHVSADSSNPLNKIIDPNNSCPLDPPRWGRTIECKEQRLEREGKQK